MITPPAIIIISDHTLADSTWHCPVLLVIHMSHEALMSWSPDNFIPGGMKQGKYQKLSYQTKMILLIYCINYTTKCGIETMHILKAESQIGTELTGVDTGI